MEESEHLYQWLDTIAEECSRPSYDLSPIKRDSMADDQDSNSGCSRDSNYRLLQSLKAQLKVSVYVNYGLLTVHLMQARHLRSKYQPTCETYIKLSLVPDESRRTQCKTDIVHDTNHPVFDEKFSFELLDGDFNKRLLISVWNKYKGRSEFLGCMSFGVHRIKQATRMINGWYYLLPEDIGRKKHLAATSKGSGGHENRVAPIPAVNKDLLWMETHVITMQRSGDGFGFSVTGGCPVQISKVEPGSVAELANLHVSDCIVHINGQNVSRSSCNSVAKIVKNTRRTLILEVQRPLSHLPPLVESPCASTPKSLLQHDVLVHSITSERYSPPPLRLEDLRDDWSHDEDDDACGKAPSVFSQDDLSSVTGLAPIPHDILFGKDVPFANTSTPVSGCRAHKRSGPPSSSNDSFEIHDSVLSDNMEVFKKPLQPVDLPSQYDERIVPNQLFKHSKEHKQSKSKSKRVKPLSRLEAQLNKDLACIRENVEALTRTKRTTSEEHLSAKQTVTSIKQSKSMWNIHSDKCRDVPRTRANTHALAIDSLLIPRTQLTARNSNMPALKQAPLQKKDCGVNAAVYDKENRQPTSKSSHHPQHLTPFDVHTLQPIQPFIDFTATQFI